MSQEISNHTQSALMMENNVTDISLVTSQKGTSISQFLADNPIVHKLIIIVPIVILIILVILGLRKLHCMLYAFMIYDGANMCKDTFRPRKEKMFTKLREEISPRHVENGQPIRILEIGAGSGSNFAFYPPNTELTVVEPLYEVKKYFLMELKQNPNVKLVDYQVRKLADAKLKDEYFDVVVGTMVLCSVKKVDSDLKKLYKTMKPNALYFYEEHILSWETKISKIQRFVCPLWFCFFHGCSITRQPTESFLKAGFQVEKCEQYKAAFPEMPVFDMVRPHIDGVLRRPETDLRPELSRYSCPNVFDESAAEQGLSLMAASHQYEDCQQSQCV